MSRSTSYAHQASSNELDPVALIEYSSKIGHEVYARLTRSLESWFPAAVGALVEHPKSAGME